MDVDFSFLVNALKIVMIDVVLSGDNAVVIAMAAHRLPKHQRRLAVLFGAGGAIVLRVLFTAIVAVLLGMPLLRFGGGVVLLWIAVKLLLQEEEDVHEVHAAGSLPRAIWTIILADCVMSLDNMLAVGGASEGHLKLLLFGLLLSIGIIMTCSALIAEWMNRFPVLVVVGAAVLALTAGEMIVNDSKVAAFVATHTGVCYSAHGHEALKKTLDLHTLEHQHWLSWSFVGGMIVFVVTSPRWSRLLARRRGRSATSAETSPLGTITSNRSGSDGAGPLDTPKQVPAGE